MGLFEECECQATTFERCDYCIHCKLCYTHQLRVLKIIFHVFVAQIFRNLYFYMVVTD